MEWNTMEPANVNRALIFAYTYLAPFLFVLGLLGSIASIITLQSSKFSARIYVYLKYPTF